MTYMLCYKLIPVTFGIVCHGLQESANRFLIEWRDASVLLNYLSFKSTHAFAQKSLSSNHIRNVHAQRSNSRQIGSIRVSPATLVASLGVAIDPANLGQILLFQVQPDPFVT